MRKCIIFIIAAAFIAVSVMPAMAQDDKSVAISGWVTQNTAWISQDKEWIDAKKGTLPVVAPSTDDATNLDWGLSGPTSFIDFRLKQGPVSGHVRVRAGGELGGNVAHLYGTWDFGMGQLIVGNAPVPTNRPAALVTWFPAGGYGAIDFQSRAKGIQGKFPVGPGTLWVALLEPVNDEAGWSNSANALITETMFPKVSANYDFKFSNFNFTVLGGYQTFNRSDSVTGSDESVDSYLLGLYGSWAMGPFTANLNVYTMQNPNEWADVNPAGFGSTRLGHVGDFATGSSYDVDHWGWHIGIAYTLSDRVRFTGGYGWAEWSRDNPAFGTVAAADITDEQSTYYIGAQITLYRNVIMYIPIRVSDLSNYEDTIAGIDQDEGKETRFGLRWRIRF